MSDYPYMFLLACASALVICILISKLYDRSIPDQMPELVTREKHRLPYLTCLAGIHEWVPRVELGGEPDPKLANSSSSIAYFMEFAAPVCKHCPRQLPPRIPR